MANDQRLAHSTPAGRDCGRVGDARLAVPAGPAMVKGAERAGRMTRPFPHSLSPGPTDQVGPFLCLHAAVRGGASWSLFIIFVMSVSAVFELSSVAFFGRTAAEYAAFFKLDLPALRGCQVLDVAAGPSSFAAEANGLGVEVTAVDPLYGCRPDGLAAHVQLDYQRVLAQMQAKPACFLAGAGADGAEGFFSSLAAAEESRRAAAARFLTDYAAHFVHGRYRGGALPALPFADASFDVVLCAHLLFIYARQFDYAFHRAAALELVRVSRSDVRIHPICGADGEPYPELERLRRELAAVGVASELEAVPYRFFRGSGTMLVLRRETG